MASVRIVYFTPAASNDPSCSRSACGVGTPHKGGLRVKVRVRARARFKIHLWCWKPTQRRVKG
jgi:hypothetical protein